MPQLVLIPGLACDDRLWQAQWPVLPASMAPSVSDVHMRHATIQEMAAALLREHEGPLVLCGASMGGMIAMEAARQAPARIEGLALLGTNPRPETPDMRELREAAIELFERGDIAGVIGPNVAFAFHPAQAADAQLVDAYLQMMLDAGAEQLIRQNRALMQRPDAREQLPGLRCPVLVMCGDTDRLTPPECSRDIATLTPAAELVWVADCGHMLTMEKPALVNATLGAWLARLDA
ncbi:alpha/beta fold hydrolase [Variovorax sp. J22G21]|uniref:alpha/beta fold hydrolase n=1 Tax=Variovorax fucosicus TaxID=3053517 RepID=UPI0025776092|nr:MULTISPECIES: alpha/beta fold hydrolase [unclassified Variovorax]MDM0039950.1 alpha/beta fold hydrolase [Variovorax sp. J22R193]MDM0061323.1 alpha/beta fold hydrolase [Variovorax sp. J22G21]